MPIGTYTMLKGTKPAFEEKSSANYYAYGYLQEDLRSDHAPG